MRGRSQNSIIQINSDFPLTLIKKAIAINKLQKKTKIFRWKPDQGLL
jgi:hypothetical protein